MYVSRYHRFLRASLLVTAVVLVFDSGILFPVTKQLSDNTVQYLASSAVGMFASVPQNEINTLTAQLTEQQRALDAREAALNAREIQARDYGNSSSSDYSTYIISVILFIIIVLLMVNYAMDWARLRKFSSHENAMG